MVIFFICFFICFFCLREVNQESEGEKMLSTLRRCFKAIDKEECGFIPSDRLLEALALINEHNEYNDNHILRIMNNPTDLARLRGHLQVDGEIILWGTFWVNISKLRSGESLDSLINYSEPAPSSAALITYDEKIQSSHEGRPRSDSEIARQLQEELDSDPNFDFSNLSTSFDSPNRNKHSVNDSYGNNQTVWPAEQNKRPRSDSEIARELQEQFNAETDFFDVDTGRSNNAHSSMDIDAVSVVAQRPSTPVQVPHQYNVTTPSNEIEERFTLYHFNGLQNFEQMGALTKLVVSRR